MGYFAEPAEFLWDQYTDQPHARRRLEILKKHPEIRQLMTARGDRRQALVGVGLGCVQLLLGTSTNYLPVPVRYFVNICLGSWIAVWHFLSLHEAAHGLVFGPNHPKFNRAYGIFLNLFLGIPVFSFFKKHHKDHHKYQGDSAIDVEYPADIERKLFDFHTISKFFWFQWNGLFQLIRSKFVGPKKPCTWEEVVNIVVVVCFDLLLCYFGHPWTMTHLMMGFFVAIGCGVVGMWNLASHTLYFPKKENIEDTVSYDGWMNFWFLNLGYHMEHHDFPNIPFRLLPQVRKIAPEFYVDRYYHDSLTTPVFKFLHQKEIGIHSRLKRELNVPEEKSR